MGKILKNFATKENKETSKVDKKYKFSYRKCFGQFERHKPCVFKDQFFNFYNFFVPDFENLHNPIQLNNTSDTNNKFNDSITSDSENSKYCETKLSSNMLGNEAEMCDWRYWSKFVSTYVTDLPKWNITDNVGLKWLNFIPTSNKVDVARLNLESERFVRMLHL